MHTTIPPRRFAVAIPVTPPVGADDIATLGANVYFLPRFVTSIN